MRHHRCGYSLDANLTSLSVLLQASGGVPALIFSDFTDVMGLEGRLPDMEKRLWCDPQLAEPRFKPQELEELSFLCIENPRGRYESAVDDVERQQLSRVVCRRSLKKGEALHALLCDQHRMAVAPFFQDLTLEGVKWLYVNHMDLLQLGPNSPVFEPMTTANLVYLVVQGSVDVSLVPGAPAPLSTWSMVRAMLDNTAHGLQTAITNGQEVPIYLPPCCCVSSAECACGSWRRRGARSE